MNDPKNPRLNSTIDGVIAQPAQAKLQRLNTFRQFMRVSGAHDEICTDLALAKKRIAADLAPLMMLFSIAQQLGHFAFGDPAADLSG